MNTTHFNQISGEYKKGFIDDVLNDMSPLLDNNQLNELNRTLKQDPYTIVTFTNRVTDMK